jgi:DNA-binding response OmpR family regulator
MTQGPQDRRALGRIALQQRPVVQPRSAAAAQDSGQVDLAALKALSEQHGVPGIDLSQVCIRLSDLDLLPREIAEKHGILPVLVRDDRVFLAMILPGEKHIIDELEFVTGKKVFPYVALAQELTRALASVYELKGRGEKFYIGPRCPAETLKRMGVEVQEAQDEPEELSALVSEPAEAGQQQDPPVVLSDPTPPPDITEISDSEFPNTSEELSVVTDMPEAAAAGRKAAAAGVRTILVVDDEVDIRKMLKRLLTERGYEVLEADRGLQALRIVKDRVPNLIILDAMLPEVHGFEIARRIKGSQRYGHIPIIMVSAVYRGWRYAEDVKSSYHVEAYIEKPFRIAEVLKAIESVMSNEAKQPKPDEAGSSAGAEQALAEGVAAYQAGNIDLAIEHLNRGVGIDPLAYRLHFHLGLLYGKKGLVYEAIQQLETALSINNKHFAAMKNLAVLYQKAGFRNKAIEMWERALSAAPDDATRQAIKDLLLNLL